MSVDRKPGILTDAEARSPQGCGAGTENACFALTMGQEGFACSLITNKQLAQHAGFRLGWRVNVDPTDEKAWCPLGVLNNSKKAQAGANEE
ncbi:hypothetical protein A2714_05730 [Candidatus Woesebacteria bacterium RIFCSPHIGHO2_01_FULL_38_9]|uniref:Uncharacterized protein n=2 Tax=Candidatus Woeseibacteriota TaxID=1752722 RepID=A0A1F7Y283_9BACT|nr:MAG: hypothetical protein A2714_05730 [Candidatus Woesebacteria bacterium RIFCSPHIGHO2_01_FULL_38_9]OGM59067.1 MAG: hypothetical protein A3A75_05375 [Candidatus Woesebacteria bacterium RIFCSPLOWO2_01_FULL_39_10]